MNWYELQESKEYYSRYKEPSRANLALGGLMMGFFAAIVAANLDSTPDLGSIVVRAAVALFLAAGAVVCLVRAVGSDKPASYTGSVADAKKAPTSNSADEPDIFNARSKAA